jgi:integrase
MANSAGRGKKEKPPLILRGGVWYANNVIVRVGDKRGDGIRASSGFREADKAKAEIWLRREISRVEQDLLYGAPPAEPAKSVTPGFADAVADYMERGGKRGPLGKNDLAKLARLAEFFADQPCDKLDQHLWNNFVDEELDGTSGETIRRWFAMFRAPARRALRKIGLSFPEFELPPAGQGRTIFLEEEVADQLHAAYAPHAQPIVTVLRYQGCRVAEALRLALPGDVSFDRKTITLRRTKNGDALRVVPMHDRTVAALRDHLGNRRLGPVFLTPAGDPYIDRQVSARGIGTEGSGIRTAHESALRRWALGQVIGRDGPDCLRCGKAAEFPRLQLIRPRAKGGGDELYNYRMVCAACDRADPRDEPRHTWFHIHDWRHHWASWFMMKGGRETELMRLGGWKDPRMVQRYVALSVEHLRKAVNQV